MNGSTSNPPSKYRADLLFWSLVIWGLHWLCGAELDQTAGALLNSKLSLEETKVPELKKRWGMMLGMYAGFWSPALPTMEGPDSSGSLTSYLPAASICSAVAEDGGRRQNRAAYWDNNVVYIGDSCKPSATVLKPCRAMCELSLACSDREWVSLPAPA